MSGIPQRPTGITLFAIMAICVWLSPQSTAQTTVVNYDSRWKIAIPAADPGVGWRGGNEPFNDSNWSIGRGLFGFETASLPEPGLLTPFGTAFSSHMVYLLRTTFIYDGPTTNARVSIDGIVDDGVTYYLNGQRIGSWQHTPGVWNNAAAAPGVENATETFNSVNAPAIGLIKGVNVLAAEVHQKGPENSDMVFGARMRILLPSLSSSDWRMQHFETTSNSDIAADPADPDGDGLANIVEYVLSTNPSQRTSKWATTKVEGSNFVMQYARRKAALDEVECSVVSATSITGPWSNIGISEQITNDDGSTQFVKAAAPLNGANLMFLKLQVRRLGVPVAPAAVIASVYSSSETDVSWSDSAGETAYRLERKSSGGVFSLVTTLPANTTTFRDTGLADGSTYIYRLIATNSLGDSAPSPEASVTVGPLRLAVGAMTPAATAVSVNFSASVNGSPASYFWNFGDGTTFTTSEGSVSHAYAQPGHFQIIVRATRGFESDTVAFTQTVHWPLTSNRPTSSSPIIIDQTLNRVWNVNPDSNTVTAIDAVSLVKQFEKPTGTNPRNLAQAPDGNIWVVNLKSATISVLARETGELVNTITLPRASQPFGVVFSPDGNSAYISLEGSGRLLRINPVTRQITGNIEIGSTPRALAVSQDSQRILVTRFISPVDKGQVTEINAATLSVSRVFNLDQDTTASDGDSAARGVPNYLAAISISPDGRRAWVASKKDNTLRGTFRDGRALTFESSVRTITSQLDLLNNSEAAVDRIDYNDRDSASAVQFSPAGDYVFVALQGSNSIAVRDAYSRASVSAVDTGFAPQGLAMTADGSRLFVHNFMSRSVRAYNTSGFISNSNFTLIPLATIPTVASETLSPQVLLGKQIFYNAKDARMNRDGYISCASCHIDGREDGRVWDFTDRGEGLRNTTTLLGKSGMGHGRVHWTGNFDEIQDFENDIRNSFGGTGFMTGAQFATGTRSATLGDPKAGVSPELDALAAYVSSLVATEPSPYRNTDHSLTTEALAGQAIFQQLNCVSCHSGVNFTDSASGLLHNVGTLQFSSGKRMGSALTGIDTPTLRGLWSTAPYLHDGSAPTLMDVLTRAAAEPGNRHGDVKTLTLVQREELIAYLKQIE